MASTAILQKSDALATRQQLPLHRKRIIITAPRQYASKLSGLLIEAGAVPVWLPGVEITRLCHKQHAGKVQQLDEALSRLHTYTHLAFTSKNGITSVMERLITIKGGVAAAASYVQSCRVKLAALGADAEVLQDYGLKVDVLPAEASTTGLVQEFSRQQQQQEQEQQQEFKVLCPVPLVTGGLVEPPVVPQFLSGLSAAGVRPTRVDSYLTIAALGGAQECEAERQMLEAGGIAAIAFSSQAEAQGLCIALGGQDVLTSALDRHHVLLAAHGPYTAAGVEQLLGRAVPCVSKNFRSFQGLVYELGVHLGRV